MNQPTSTPGQFHQFHELAAIHGDTFQEDPLQMNQISLEFSDGRKWVSRDLVFPISSLLSNDYSSFELESLPVGTIVAAVTPRLHEAPLSQIYPE